MNQKQKDDEEEEQPVDSKVYFDQLLEVLGQLVSLFEGFQHSHKFKHFDHFIHLWKLGSSK